MNRILNPVLELSSKSEVHAFLDMTKEPVENTKFFANHPVPLNRHYSIAKYPGRALALIFDPEEYEQELLNVKEAARGSSIREALRFGLVKGKSLIRHYKSQFGNLWF